MSFPRESIDAARTTAADGVNGLLEWVDRLDGLTRTQAQQLAALAAVRDGVLEDLAARTAERDAARADRDAALADRAALAAERDALRAQLGRVAVGPVAALFAEVMALVESRGDPVLSASWAIRAAAVAAQLGEAAAAGGVRRDHPLVPTFRAFVLADGLMAAEEVDQKLAAAGLTDPAGGG